MSTVLSRKMDVKRYLLVTPILHSRYLLNGSKNLQITMSVTMALSKESWFYFKEKNHSEIDTEELNLFQSFQGATFLYTFC